MLMITFRVHGRQNDVEKATRILSRACFLGGFETQDFVTKSMLYDSEATGFVRIEKGEIITTKEPVLEPDFVIIFDENNAGKFTKDAKPETIVFFNSKRGFGRVKNTYSVDATGIAFNILGKPVLSMPMLGAISKIFKNLSMKAIKNAIEHEITELRNVNMNMIEDGYRTVR